MEERILKDKKCEDRGRKRSHEGVISRELYSWPKSSEHKRTLTTISTGCVWSSISPKTSTNLLNKECFALKNICISILSAEIKTAHLVYWKESVNITTDVIPVG